MRIIRPSFLSFNEYYKLTNPSGKYHDSDSYSSSIESLNQYDWIEDFKTVKQRFRVNGIDFEIRESKEDKLNWTYYKPDKEGFPTDEVYSLEEKKKFLPEHKRYKIEHAVIESKTNKIVSMTQDEWGALLITSAKEFEGFGVGQKLLNYHRSLFPIRDSGGHTPQGFQAVFKFYQEEVKKSLISGEYRKEINKGNLTKEKVKEIVSSAMLSKSTMKQKYDYDNWILSEGVREKFGIKPYREKQKDKKKKQENWDMSNENDVMLLLEDNYAILYNKKSFEQIENTKSEYFLERGLLGYVYIGGVLNNDSIPKIHRIYGKNEKIENFMMEVAFEISKGEQLRVYAEEDYLIPKKLKYVLDSIGFDLEKKHKIYQLNETSNELVELMGFLEKKYRKENDKFDEKKILLQEMIYGIAEDIEGKRENIQSVILRCIGDGLENKKTALEVVRKLDVKSLDILNKKIQGKKIDSLKEIVDEQFGFSSVDYSSNNEKNTVNKKTKYK